MNHPIRDASSDDFFSRHLGAARVMAILRGYDPDRTVELCRRAWAMGVGLVEVPVQDDRSLAALQAAVEAGNGAGYPVGAGTIVSQDLVNGVRRAGASFTVAPCWDPAVASASADSGMPHLPGVASPTEIHQALRHGHHWQKLFPAGALGTDWVRAVLAPYPSVRLVATGGIDGTNAADFLAAGAAAVSLGSALSRVTPATVQSLLQAVNAE